jgi:hypothetical protein
MADEWGGKSRSFFSDVSRTQQSSLVKPPIGDMLLIVEQDVKKPLEAWIAAAANLNTPTAQQAYQVLSTCRDAIDAVTNDVSLDKPSPTAEQSWRP